MKASPPPSPKKSKPVTTSRKWYEDGAEVDTIKAIILKDHPSYILIKYNGVVATLPKPRIWYEYDAEVKAWYIDVPRWLLYNKKLKEVKNVERS